jgi:hypothetical protein
MAQPIHTALPLPGRRALTGALLIALAGCGLETSEPVGGPGGPGGKADSSAHAVFLDFDIEGELVLRDDADLEKRIDAQLMYTVGQLNGERSVGRLDRIELSDVASEWQPSGELRVTYRARMPVAWNRANDVPTEYTFVLPRDVSIEGLEEFASRYGRDCVDYGDHSDAGVFWYYYRPDATRCPIDSRDEQDAVELAATVSPSAIQTTGKYPEYQHVWADDVLRVVAITGKDEDGSTSPTDAGIASHGRLVRELLELLEPYDVQTEPAVLPDSPGLDTPAVHFEAELPNGFRIVVDALLVDNVQAAGTDFDTRYEELSSRADYIFYNGHSGLGANIRALAQKGRWIPEQYVLVFMNGCDTYAYIDSSLAEAHAAVNVDDPNGTRYLDIVANAMPAPISREVETALILLRALLQVEEPMTYEEIFETVNTSQVILVTGEADNEFAP